MIPPPRFNLTRYSGVLAARAAWRKEVVPQPKVDLRRAPTLEELSQPKGEGEASAGETSYRQAWAALLAKIYKVDALACSTPGCDGRLRIVAAILKKDIGGGLGLIHFRRFDGSTRDKVGRATGGGILIHPLGIVWMVWILSGAIGESVWIRSSGSSGLAGCGGSGASEWGQGSPSASRIC
jgi:hypothetical protein